MGQIEGLKVCRRAPSITHLLFADDSLLFFRANMQQATAVKLLSVFERCTGQRLSPSKCSILMNESRDATVHNQIRDLPGVQRVDFEAKYLGLPTPHGQLKRGVFQPLEERFQKRMSVWKEKELSAAGKEILI